MSVLKALTEEGFFVTNAAVEEAIEEVGDSLKDVRTYLLDSDFKDVGAKHLPKTAASNLKLQGPLILQVSAIRDISRPSKASSFVDSGKPGNRVLMLTLTDGNLTVRAIEYSPIVWLGTALVPGMKVRLLNTVEVRNGFALLSESNVEVVGGNVEHLVSEWRAQSRKDLKGATGAPRFVVLTPEMAKQVKRAQSSVSVTSKPVPTPAPAQAPGTAQPAPITVFAKMVAPPAVEEKKSQVRIERPKKSAPAPAPAPAPVPAPAPAPVSPQQKIQVIRAAQQQTKVDPGFLQEFASMKIGKLSIVRTNQQQPAPPTASPFVDQYPPLPKPKQLHIVRPKQ